MKLTTDQKHLLWLAVTEKLASLKRGHRDAITRKKDPIVISNYDQEIRKHETLLHKLNK